MSVKGKKDSTAMAFPSSEASRQRKHVVMAPPGTRPKAVGANKAKKKPNVVRVTLLAFTLLGALCHFE